MRTPKTALFGGVDLLLEFTGLGGDLDYLGLALLLGLDGLAAHQLRGQCAVFDHHFPQQIELLRINFGLQVEESYALVDRDDDVVDVLGRELWNQVFPGLDIAVLFVRLVA